MPRNTSPACPYPYSFWAKSIAASPSFAIAVLSAGMEVSGIAGSAPSMPEAGERGAERVEGWCAGAYMQVGGGSVRLSPPAGSKCLSQSLAKKLIIKYVSSSSNLHGKTNWNKLN